MTVKLLSEEELLNLDADAPGYDVLDRLVGVHQWAAKAHAWMQRVAPDEHLFGCGRYPLVDRKPASACTCGHAALLTELTPPTPEER